MNDLEDFEMPAGGEEPPPAAAKPRSMLWVVVVAGLLLAATAIYFVFRGTGATEEPPPVAAAAPPPASTAVAEPVEEEPEFQLPTLDASDAVVRQLVGALSSHPQLARWLVTDELVRRFAASIDNIANGTIPKTHLRFLEPRGGFERTQRGGREYIDQRSYRRYGALAAVFSSLDTDGVVELYDNLKPLIEEAYRDLGYPDRDFDKTLGRAINRLLATPVPTGDVELVPRGVESYGFADQGLEGLSAAQKQLLRTGPDNMRLVMAKLRELGARLGVL